MQHKPQKKKQKNKFYLDEDMVFKLNEIVASDLPDRLCKGWRTNAGQDPILLLSGTFWKQIVVWPSE